MKPSPHRGSPVNSHQQPLRPGTFATLPVHRAESGPLSLSVSPDYFTRSTSLTLKAVALVFLIAGHVYAFFLGGIGLLNQAGEWGVLIFLMVSGMGLVKSYGLEPCGMPFIQRRFAKIAFPLWVSLAMFYGLDYVLIDTTYAWYEIALSFAGIIPKAPPNATLWFIPFIIYLYGVFFLVAYLRVPIGAKCVLLGLFAFGTTTLITRVPLLSCWFGGWTTYTFAFPLSVCVMCYQQVFRNTFSSRLMRIRPLQFIAWLAMAVLFWFTPTAKTAFFAAFVAISVSYLDGIASKPKFILFLGRHSYEIYLVHFPFLVSYGLVDGGQPIPSLAVYCVGIVLMGVALRKVSDLLSRVMQIGGNAEPRSAVAPFTPIENRLTGRVPSGFTCHRNLDAPTGGNHPPKILHVITRLDMGGSSQNTLLSCRELARRYETVLVHGLTGESRMTPDEQAAVERLKADAAACGTRFIPMPALVRRIHPVLDLAALWGLWRCLLRERPDIVHTHTSKAGILGRLAARLAGVPHVVHTPHGHVFYGHFGPIGSRLFLALERRFARMTDRIVALTGGERRDYLELGVGVAQDIRLVHSGVEFGPGETGDGERGDSDARRRALGLDPARRVVGFVGWLLPVKGPHHLLNAMRVVWSQHPETDLVFVGRGDLEGPLKAQAAFTGHADRVRFLGWREDVREVMPVFDLLVLPSLNEGMGRVLLEAMAAGRPVVASRVGGIPDLVRDEENGLLVPPGDEQALAAAIARLLQDPALARRLGEAGRGSCREFGVDAMAARLDRMYRELLTPDTAVMDVPDTAHPQRGPAAMRNECWPTG